MIKLVAQKYRYLTAQQHFNFFFNDTVSTTTFVSPDSYEIGVSASTGFFTATECRDALFDAIVDARSGTPPTPLECIGPG